MSENRVSMVGPHDAVRSAVGALGASRLHGRLLLVRTSYGARNWQLPGGYLEPGESPLTALYRELREELGVAPPTAGFAGVCYRAYEANISFVFSVEPVDVDGSLVDPAEIADFGWFGPAALPDPMSPRTSAIVRALFGDEQPFLLVFDGPETGSREG